MSFALTVRQMRRRTKTVTRRIGWWDLKTGDVVCAVEKGQGLKKGEKVKRIGPIKILSARPERLDRITTRDVEKEGFPGTMARTFVREFCRNHRGCRRWTRVNRIEFKFV